MTVPRWAHHPLVEWPPPPERHQIAVKHQVGCSDWLTQFRLTQCISFQSCFPFQNKPKKTSVRHQVCSSDWLIQFSHFIPLTDIISCQSCFPFQNEHQHSVKHQVCCSDDLFSSAHFISLTDITSCQSCFPFLNEHTIQWGTRYVEYVAQIDSFSSAGSFLWLTSSAGRVISPSRVAPGMFLRLTQFSQLIPD